MKFTALQQFKAVDFDRNLIQSLSGKGPRYTSYPTADRFIPDFTEPDYLAALQRRQSTDASNPLSLYVHIPFCNTICYYCGCNKIITKDKSKADIYIDYLGKELSLLSEHLHNKPIISQLHFGGGTPTFLNDSQLETVFKLIKQHFTLVENGEYSIEIDPRKVTRSSVFKLKELGFNRMSIGIQDFNLDVQKAVNRVQTEEETAIVINAAREAGFKSISVDLIYGLPHQTLDSMRETLDRVLALDPDRLAIYHYAHLPHLFKPQRRINETDLPSSEEKLDILQMFVETLIQKGYVFIGMDHFAKPNDELSLALNEGRLQRNFQGYSTYADCDMVSIGVSSIGKVGDIYAQNERDIDAYYQSLDNNQLPIFRGMRLDADDLLRRQLIQDLMCRFQLQHNDYEKEFGIQFKEYFAAELADLEQFVKLGLVNIEDNYLWVTAKGRFLIRNIAMVFDKHLRERNTQATYSQTV